MAIGTAIFLIALIGFVIMKPGTAFMVLGTATLVLVAGFLALSSVGTQQADRECRDMASSTYAPSTYFYQDHPHCTLQWHPKP